MKRALVLLLDPVQMAPLDAYATKHGVRRDHAALALIFTSILARELAAAEDTRPVPVQVIRRKPWMEDVLP